MLGFSPLSTDSRGPFFAHLAPKQAPVANLPAFIKPLPARIGPDEVSYLEKKGALTIPATPLRNELLRAYVEFVHPYMPLLDLHEFVVALDNAEGNLGKISLILFQSVMFAGSAFVDMRHLRAAGYVTRKEARKDFFQKTRVSSHLFLPPPQLWRCTRLRHSDWKTVLTEFSYCTTSTMNPTAFRWCRRSFS